MNTPKRRGALLAAGLMTIALTATACGSGGGGSSSEEDAGKPVKGGTLNMLGHRRRRLHGPQHHLLLGRARADPHCLRAASCSPTRPTEGKTNTVVPDLAEEVPTTDNGGISADGKTYTIKLRSGVKWNTSPARPVTAEDVVRGVKRTCNPVQPFGGIRELHQPDRGHARSSAPTSPRWAPTRPRPTSRSSSTATSCRASSPRTTSTVVFKLTQPATYFVDMLTLAAFSPAPVEVMKYVPGQRGARQEPGGRRSVQDRQVRADQVHRAQPQPGLGRLDRPGPQGLRRQDRDRRDR